MWLARSAICVKLRLHYIAANNLQNGATRLGHGHQNENSEQREGMDLRCVALNAYLVRLF